MNKIERSLVWAVNLVVIGALLVFAVEMPWKDLAPQDYIVMLLIAVLVVGPTAVVYVSVGPLGRAIMWNKPLDKPSVQRDIEKSAKAARIQLSENVK